MPCDVAWWAAESKRKVHLMKCWFVLTVFKAGLLVVFASGAAAVELPPVDVLQEEMGKPAETVSVFEPHMSVGEHRVVANYIGYSAVEVFERVFGEDWPTRAETVELRALDGYVARIDAVRFMTDGAYLVFAREDGSAFMVSDAAQNETDVPLGPYYLVWDTVANPELLSEGGRNWPYQVTAVNLVTLSFEALVPPGLDVRFHETADRVRTFCLSCHQVNGYGGEKYPANLAEVAQGYDESEFVQWILDPHSVFEDSTMPAVLRRFPEAEQQRIAAAIFEYLNAVPVLDEEW